MENTSLWISILALLISGYVAYLHSQRDKRESRKFELEKNQSQKKLRFSVSELNYSFEQGLDQDDQYYSDHVLFFDVIIQNIGIPTIFIDQIGVIFTKPLLGEKIKSFNFRASEINGELNTNKSYKMHFSQGFKTAEEAYKLIDSRIIIKCLDINGDVYSSKLIKPKFGESI